MKQLPPLKLMLVALLLLLPGSPASGGRPAIATVAAQLAPGSWADLNAARPRGLMSVFTGYRKSGKPARYHIAGWTDDAHWDAASGQVLFMGYRKRHKFIAYSADNNRWRVLSGPFGWPEPDSGSFKDERQRLFGHPYGGNAFDPDARIYYHHVAGYTYGYELEQQRWFRVKGGNNMSMEVLPGVGLLAHSRKADRSGGYPVSRLDRKSGQWQPFATLPFSGYHGLARYNPRRDEMLFVAGNDSRAVASLSRDGQVRLHKELPFDISIRHGKLVVDPVSGRYLLFQHNRLYEFDSENDRYRHVEAFQAPWGKYEMPVPAAIPEYGVILFVDRKTLIYRHTAAASPD